jgi:GH18 family chitinase
MLHFTTNGIGKKGWKGTLVLLSFMLTAFTSSWAQVNTGGSATTANHSKQVVGYLTNWDAWKAAAAGLPAQGALNHLNIDYGKYTILNFSFFGVAKDGSLHSGDLRNKNINQAGQVQEPGPMLHPDLYSSWDWYLLFGELELIQYISKDVQTRATAQGFQCVENGTTWSFPSLGIMNQALPMPLRKVGGAPGLLDLAHEKGVKVMASIGGWSMCKHFPEMAADPVKKQRFIDDCVKLINTGFDGIDLDWEYPGPYAGMNFTGTQADFVNFENLVQSIRTAIGPNKLITAAFSADPVKLQGFNWSKLNSTMNYFNIMTYDYNGGWSNKAGHNSPIFDYPNSEEPTFNWQSAYNGLVSFGAQKSKINMGAPFYGRGVITSGAAALNAPTVKRSETVQPDGPISTCADYTNWPKEVYDGTPNYFYVKQKTGAGSGWTRGWDNNAKVPYMTNGSYFLSYDDEESVGHKAQYIVDNQLAGSIVWTVFGDLEFSGSPTQFGKLIRYSSVKSTLVNKINEVFAAGGTGNPPPTASITLPINNATFSAPATITINASATDNGSVTKVDFYKNGEYLGTDTSSPYSFTWNSVAAGSYALTAKATDNQGSETTSSAVNVTVGTITNPAPTVSITSPSNGSTFTPSSNITIQATAADTQGGSVTKVEFYQNGQFLGVDTSSPYSFTWNSVAAGSYQLTAVATDNGGATTTSATVSISGSIVNPSTGFHVVGYMPSWAGSASSIQYNKLTHIMYSFIRPTSSGGLTAVDQPQKLKDIVKSAHAAGVKVCIAIGGWSDTGNADFEEMAASASARNAFVTNTMNLVSEYQLDGVDMDWEYPTGTHANTFATLMDQLATALHAQGKILTAAVAAHGWNADGILSSVFEDIDFLNLMAYDGDMAGPGHSPYSYAEASVNYWLNRGLPASKTVLGVPFYGRPGGVSYANLLSQGASPNEDLFQGVYYNGIPTIKKKTNLAFDKNLGGIMFWELSQDVDNANSLVTAIKEVKDVRTGGNNNNPPAAPSNLVATAASSTQITLTWSDNSNNENFFRVERASPNVDSGWITVATLGTNTTSLTDGGLAASTRYYYRVRAENLHGSSAYTNTANATTTVTGSVNLALNKSVTTTSNETAAFTGANAVDGSGTTRWASTYSDNQAITVDLGAMATINKVVLKWEAAYGKSYRIETSSNGTSFSTLVTQTNSDGGTDEYSVSTSARYVRMQGVSRATAWGYSLWEFEVFGTIGSETGPTAPSNLTASATSTSQINLSWSDNSNNETLFRIDRSTDGSNWSSLTTVSGNVTTYSNTGLSASTTYHYRVRAENAGGNSAYSNTANATTQGTGTTPAAPSNLSATASSTSQINLSWSDNSSNETSFRVERSADGSSSWTSIATVGANVTTYSNTGLSASTTYHYRVRAENASGNSAYSNTANATTQGTGGGCSGIPSYASGVTYNAGAVVENGGTKYECKPWPFSGWCGAGPAYAPGVGFAWQDAWTLVGACSASARASVQPEMQAESKAAILYPNQGKSGVATTAKLEVGENVNKVRVRIDGTNGVNYSTQEFINPSGTVEVHIPALPSGMYIIKEQTLNKTKETKFLVN